MPPAPTAGESTGAPNCPICLDEVESRTTALNCRHVFCYGCISHWVRRHNRCPLCRSVIRQLLHQVTEPGSSTPVDRYEDVTVPEEMRGFTINLGFLTVVHTPEEEPLNMVQPVTFQNSLRVFYLLRVLEPDHTFFMAGISPGTQFVLGESLAEVTSVLEANGIFRIEAGLHEGALHRHASYLELHAPHTI